MSATKTNMMMAILALFLCLTSTVTASSLYSPGKPLNCTAFADNCNTLAMSLYSKNASFNGPSAQCNVTNLSAAQPLCNEKVICLATFLVMTNSTNLAVANSSSSVAAATTTSAAGVSTTSSAAPATPTNGTSSIPNVYTVTSQDLTSQLIALYDTTKCGSGAVATTVSAFVIIATVISMAVNLL
ncbi:hypothetical protein BGZ46_010554 [Entomortierella lignicola]|nr:hypothetical protein BGZ46_010554 [Entomortierella lignicola]